MNESGSGRGVIRPYLTDVVANDALCSTLGRAVEDNTLAHAYIFEGGPGYGKHTLALRLAAAIVCEKRDARDGTPLPCLTCPACRKLLAGNNPDLTFLGRGDKATIGVETMRFLRSDVCVAPIESPAKIYVIEDAHTMTVQAQNAFLLTLEEPPAYVLFLLLCDRSDTLLETIRSRAPVLRLLPASPDVIRDYLGAHAAPKLKQLPADELEPLILSADGSIGRALDLLDPRARTPILERRRIAEEFVRGCLSRKDAEQALKLITALGKTREELGVQLLLIEDALRDLILLKRTDGAPLSFWIDREGALFLADSAPMPRFFALYEAVEEARQSIVNRNANIRLATVHLAMQTGLLAGGTSGV